MAQNDPIDDVDDPRVRDQIKTPILEKTAELVKISQALAAEIDARQRAEAELRLVLETLQFGAVGGDFDSALRMTLDQLCSVIGWDIAVLWVATTDGELLEAKHCYYRDAELGKRFESLSGSIAVTMGTDIAGKVWQSRQAEWFEELADLPSEQFPTARGVRAAGLRSALAAPVVADDRIYGVIVLQSSEKRPADPHTIALVSNVARYLGSLGYHRQRDEELHRSETLLRSVIDNSTRVIYLKDSDGRYVTVNHQFEKLFRLPLEDVTGKADEEIFPAEIAAAFRANDLKVIEAGAPMEFEEVARHEDGLHIYLVNKFPLFDSTGKLYAVCGISTDITEQKRLEDDLRQSREALTGEVALRTSELIRINQDLLLANAQKVQALEALKREKEFSSSLIDTAQVIVLLLDAEGRVVFYNPYFEKLSGYPLEETKGEDWFSRFIPERDRSSFRTVFDNAIAGLPVSGNINSIVTKDGREREIDWSVVIHRGPDNRLEGLLCSGGDITERLKAEAWSRRLIEITQDAVIGIDRQGRILAFNPAAERIFGYSIDEVVGHQVNILMAEPYASEHDEYIASYERTGEAKAIGRIRRVAAKRKDGREFPVELSVTKIEVDEEVHYAAFIRDISAAAELQARAVENERLAAIGGTAARIGHEIANPLNGIYLTLQLVEQRLARQPPADERVAEDLTKVKKEIGRLNQLVQEFRNLSRKQEYKFRPTHLPAIIDEILDLQRSVCESHGIRITRSDPADLPELIIDEDKLKQALLNLVKNAIETMAHGGELTVATSRSGDEVVIAVSDTGSGVALGTDVFAPFLTTKKEGSGLGLIIVRQIVSAHGGTISYENRQDEGTTFRIVLPLNSAAN